MGYNYRLPNLNAALGCAQLEQLPGLLDAQRRLHARYAAAFSTVSGVRLMVEPAGCHSNYWLQTLLLDQTHRGQRDVVLTVSNKAGYMTRPIWVFETIVYQRFVTARKMPLPVAESLERRVINIPSSAHLAMESVR